MEAKPWPCSAEDREPNETKAGISEVYCLLSRVVLFLACCVLRSKSFRRLFLEPGALMASTAYLSQPAVSLHPSIFGSYCHAVYATDSCLPQTSGLLDARRPQSVRAPPGGLSMKWTAEVASRHFAGTPTQPGNRCAPKQLSKTAHRPDLQDAALSNSRMETVVVRCV